MPSRRDVLAGAGTISVAVLAGCSALDGMPHGITIAVGEPDRTPTPSPTPSQTATPSRTPSDSDEPPDSGADDGGRRQQVIRYRALSTAEQALVEKGFDGGYRTCEEVPDAADALADRIHAEHVYVRYRGDLYGLWLTITDLVYASTTDPPDGECGWF